MSTGQSERMILAIGVGDNFLYVYNSFDELLADQRICAGAAKKYGAFEFFDSDGCRLAATYDWQWRLQSMSPAGSGEPGLLLKRMRNCLDNLRCHIKDHFDEVKTADMTVEDAENALPELGEEPDLATAMRKVADHFPRTEPRTLRTLPRRVWRGLSAQQGCGNPVSCWCRIVGC